MKKEVRVKNLEMISAGGEGRIKRLNSRDRGKVFFSRAVCDQLLSKKSGIRHTGSST